MATLYYESSFAHHGVKGQKWGVRRYQDKTGRLTKAGKARLKMDKTGHRKLTTNTVKELGKDTARFLGGSTAISVASAFIPYAYPAYLAQHFGRIGIRKVRNFHKADGSLEDLDSLKRMPKKESVDESLVKANAGKPRLGSGYEVNCASCSIAMDMRQKGYDVRARRQNNGMFLPDIATMYKGGSVEHISNNHHASPQAAYNNVYDTLASVNKGNSSGILTMSWKGFGGGHAIYYKSVKGEVEFYDGQVGKLGTKIDKYFVQAKPDDFDYIRTDDKKPYDLITECVVTRKDKK